MSSIRPARLVASRAAMALLVVGASAALEVKPELAPALFVRAWGEYLADPSDPQIAADLAAAAQLAPGDALFGDAAQAFPVAGR